MPTSRSSRSKGAGDEALSIKDELAAITARADHIGPVPQTSRKHKRALRDRQLRASRKMVQRKKESTAGMHAKAVEQAANLQSLPAEERLTARGFAAALGITLNAFNKRVRYGSVPMPTCKMPMPGGRPVAAWTAHAVRQHLSAERRRQVALTPDLDADEPELEIEGQGQ